jgi:hypothetical protein
MENLIMKQLSRGQWISVAMMGVLLALVLSIGSIALAQDGRINQQVWVNGWGAVAMYCHGANDQPSGSYANGWIVGLDENGQEIVRVDAVTITAGHIEADETGLAVLIFSGDIYQLYALPDGFFALYTIPDAEGKSFIARWKGCDPISYPAGAAPIIVPMATEELTLTPR